MPNNNILIIGGTGRSGTSVLNRIFSSHHNVTNVPEWRFLIDPDGIIDFYNSTFQWSPYHYDIKYYRLERLLNAVSRQNFFLSSWAKLIRGCKLDSFFNLNLVPSYARVQTKRYCPEFDYHVQNLLTDLKQFSFTGRWVGTPLSHPTYMKYHRFKNKNEIADILSNFLYAVIESVLEHQNCEYYLEKNTWNILWFDSIRELLPNAKLVHIYRDPRDVVASYINQQWMPSEPVQSAIIYRDILNRWFNVREKLPQNSYFEIALENLVSAPQDTLQAICQFWEIPWDESLLNISLDRSHTGRWKRDMTEKQQGEIQQVLHEQICTLGYLEK